jgi:glycosyltransferase involved in cell wall biosynthesis
MRKISAVIITKNEERNIERCLDSVFDIAEDIVVLDSFSTDRTEEICFKYNVKFVQRAWTNYADARNYATSLAMYDLVLAIDADEQLDEELKVAIAAAKKEDEKAYQFNRITSIGGKWIKHSGWHPDWKTRLFDRRLSKWEGIIHEKPVFSQKVDFKKLDGLCKHYSYYSAEEFINRSMHYASLSAERDFKNGKNYFFSVTALKPIIKFLSVYIYNLGFLDGAEGLLIAKTSAAAMKFRMQKLQELRKQKQPAR